MVSPVEDVAKGHRAIFGLVRATAWGTPILAAAGHGLELGPGGEGIQSNRGRLVNDSLDGGAQELDDDAGGPQTHAGALSDLPVVFDQLHRPLAFPMGTAGVPAGPVLTIREAKNDRLDFVEGTSGAAVALLTPGDYTLTALATHITTQMDAAATDNTYTVSESSGTFTIARATGTDTIDLPFLTGVNAARTVATTVGHNKTDKTGSTSYAGETVVASTLYKHVLKVSDVIAGLFFTYVIGYPSIAVREYTTGKFDGFTLSMGQSAKWRLALPGIFHSGTFDDSGTNKKATLSGITIPGDRLAVAAFGASKIRMNARSGAALADSDKLFASSASFQLARSLDQEYTLEFGDRISEPLTNAKLKFSGDIAFARLQTNLADLVTSMALTPQKIDMEVTGKAVAVDETKYAMRIYMPSVQFQMDSTIGGAGVVGKTYNFEAKKVTTLPTGFPTGYLDAMTIEILNTDSADPLA